MNGLQYWVTVDGAEYKLKDRDLPAFDPIRRIHTVTVIRPSGEERQAYSRLRNGPFTFTLQR